MSSAETITPDDSGLDRPKLSGPPAWRRSTAGVIGLLVLSLISLACFGSLPWTLATVDGSPRFDIQVKEARHIPPAWAPHDPAAAERLNQAGLGLAERAAASAKGVSVEVFRDQGGSITPAEGLAAQPSVILGTDVLGRDLLVRCLIGGAISLGIGLAAAFIAVLVGTIYGALAGYAGGRIDAVMMRFVDVLYGLPYVLLVVLLAVASDSVIEEYVSRARARQAWTVQRAADIAQQRGLPTDRAALEDWLRTDPPAAQAIAQEADANPSLRRRDVSQGTRTLYDLVTLLVAIGGVSWLTMARVVRGQVLSLKAQPFMEAARAIGVPVHRQFLSHLLPNLVGPVVVYATLTVPQAILQESFLSFLGIGVKPPLPSWGNLAADALQEINPVQSRWWLLLFPCMFLGITLLAMNFVGEGLREALDPKRGGRR